MRSNPHFHQTHPCADNYMHVVDQILMKRNVRPTRFQLVMQTKFCARESRNISPFKNSMGTNYFACLCVFNVAKRNTCIRPRCATTYVYNKWKICGFGQYLVFKTLPRFGCNFPLIVPSAFINYTVRKSSTHKPVATTGQHAGT